jgi:hypothetical protein
MGALRIELREGDPCDEDMRVAPPPLDRCSRCAYACSGTENNAAATKAAMKPICLPILI